MINDHKAPIKLKVHSRDKLSDYETQFGGKWKIQLTMQINFVSSKDSEETRTMSTKSNEIMMGNETSDILEELRESLLQRYQNGLEEKMKGSDFVRDNVDLLYHHLHKTRLKRGGSYIKSPEWFRNKRATINLKNNDDNCFQYAITVALDYDKIENHPERISNIEPFINQYKRKEIDFPSHEKDWKKFEKNNKTTALNILFVPYNTKQIMLPDKSKYNH